MRYTCDTTSSPSTHATSVMYRSPEHNRLMLKAVVHVCQTWLQHVSEGSPHRAVVMSAQQAAESAIDDGYDRRKTCRAIAAFCDSCLTIHPDLGSSCTNRHNPEAGLIRCWLIGLLAGKRT